MELDRTKPPAFLLYIDQGEELYVRAEERQRHRFSEVIAQAVADLRLYILMSMRTDFLGELQKDEPLYKVHRQIKFGARNIGHEPVASTIDEDRTFAPHRFGRERHRIVNRRRVELDEFEIAKHGACPGGNVFNSNGI